MVRILGYPQAYKLGVLGDILSAPQALEIGFVEQVVSPQELIDRCLDIANQIASNVPPLAQRMFKIINDGDF